jgi:hypothetical protein
MHLNNSRCYLSGAIENGDETRNWRVEPIRVFTENFKINVFDPFSDPKQQWVDKLKKARDDEDFDTIEEIAKRFVRKDLCLVDRVDFLVAYLPYKVPTTGVTHEIINSNNAKKPTLLVSDRKKDIPLWYYGFIDHRKYMFNGWDALYRYLEEVDKGNHQDDDKWSFVYKTI